ncbi:MAG: hypothetical protein WKF37_10180 [Bryobacteraceae bacterium]
MKNKIIIALFFALACTGVRGANEGWSVFQKGLALEKSLEVLQAREQFRTAIAKEPANPGYREHYAWFLFLNGFTEEAATAFREALPLAKNKADMRRSLAWTERALGRTKQALVLYRSIYPLRPPAQSSLSETLQRIDRNTAKENAEKINTAQMNLSRRPGDASLWRKLFEAHLYAKDYKNAEAIGARIKAKNPRDLAFRLQYARMFFWEGKKERAEMEYKALIVESPNNAFLFYELGNIQTAIGKCAKPGLIASFSRCTRTRF